MLRIISVVALLTQMAASTMFLGLTIYSVSTGHKVSIMSIEPTISSNTNRQCFVPDYPPLITDLR